MSDDEYEEPTNTEPQVLIDKSILPTSRSLLNTPKSSKVAYTVNNTTFYNEERSNEEFVQFELYAEKLTNLANRKLFRANEVEEANAQMVFCSSPDIFKDAELNYNNDQELKITIQTIPHGIVINSNVYLTHEQWNTIMFIDLVLIKCVVCELFTDVESSDIHMRGEVHKSQLDKYKPLAKFDLSITRKIQDKYHCAVCNETFSIDADIDHYASQSHEGNLLSAINKVSDLNLDRNANNDRNKINESYHFNADIEQNAQPGNSYATMLKKPKLIDMPLFLERELGNKKVKVRFDSWHMLISPKVNRFYCMVCKEFSHISCKPEHCADSTHLENLEKCKIITRFGDYLIREVDDKYYHCGHCNNLVIINDVKEHIEKNHSKYNKNAGDGAKNTTKNSDNDKNCFNDNDNGIIDNGTPAKSINDTKKANDLKGTAFNDIMANNINVMNNDDNNLNSVNKVLYENIVLTTFGYNITVSVMSFHVLCKRPLDYYCGLCNMLCAEDMIVSHIYSISHIQLMQRTPFILPFSCNLIRAIREALHCAICNLPVTASVIYLHIREPTHLQLLSKALGVVPNNQTNLTIPQANDPSILAVKTDQSKPMQTENKTTTEKNELTKEPKRTPEKTEATKEKAKFVAAKTETTKVDSKLNKERKLTETEAETTQEIDLNASLESDFDLDDILYVKLKNIYYRISVTSYNTLVHLGDNKRYCFVCSSKIVEEELKKHVECRSHLENMNECKFLDRDESLLRQSFLMYHCSTCNVLVSRKELKNHLIWPTHIEEISSIQKVSKKMRKNEIKSGANMHTASTQKEEIYLNGKETESKLLFKVKIVEKDDIVLEKKMKIVIVDGDVLKINFENWNGVAKVKNGLKCQLCQLEICDEELASHISSENHARYLTSSTFNEEYMSDLLRQINESTLHCMVCNTEVSNKDFIILEHVGGKKHKKNYEIIRNMSSTTSAYTDCEGDVLQL